jgi:hypothetical protein
VGNGRRPNEFFRKEVTMPPKTFAPGSPTAQQVVPSLGYRDGSYKERGGPVSAIVVHTTGGGPVRRFEDAKERTKFGYTSPFDAGVRIYRDLMDAGPHYVVGQLKGEVAQVAPENVIAWHVGSSGAHIYDRKSWSTTATKWWPVRWAPLKSPFELAGGKLWSGGSCNTNTVGIEVVPPAKDVRGAWSDEAWATLVALVSDIAKRHGVPVDKTHIVTHSDAHPLARSAAGKPWDPPPKQWSWEAFARTAGL